ncbi:MAG: YfhO family protein [Bacteroidota bacterium]
MQTSFFKKNASYIWIIIGFLLVSIIYCLPQFQGKTINMHDGVSWESTSQEPRMYEDSTGIKPLWSNAMFGGMPTYTHYLTGVKNYVFKFQTAISKVIPIPTFLFFFAMLGFFVLSCSLKINKWIGAIGAIAYAFATYNLGIVASGHVTKMFSIAEMPGVLAGFIMIYNGRRLSGAAIMALFFTLMVSVSHYQMVYYTVIMLFIAGIGIAINELRNGRLNNLLIGTAITILTGVLSLGPSLPTILLTKEYAQYTMRGGGSELKQLKSSDTKKEGGLDVEYAFRWSNGIGETFCLIVPQLYGGGGGQNIGTDSKLFKTLTEAGLPEASAEQFVENAPTYWGSQPFLAGPVYFGAIICFLFVLGMMIIRSPHKWWILATCVLAILMSLGRHLPLLNNFLFDYLPMYNKFRVPSMILVVPQLLFPMVGVWALNDIFTKKIAGDELWKNLKIATIATAGLCLLLAIGGQAFFDFKASGLNMADAQLAQQFNRDGGNEAIASKVLKALSEDRATMAMNSGLLSAFFILAAAAVLYAFNTNKVNNKMAIGVLALLVALDMLPTARVYLNDNNYIDTEEYQAQFNPRPVDAEILRDKDPYYRVLDLSRDTYNDAMQSYHHKTIGGYSAVKMESYQDLINVHLSGPFNGEVLNMLNTKYVIFNGGPNGQPAYQPNPGTCGNAWFVNEVKYVNNADEEMKSMNAPGIGDTTVMPNSWKANQTAIIRNTFASKLNNTKNFIKDSLASVRLEKYGLNEISFVSSNSHEGLAVFSDIYYDKGWKAYVDGKETPIVKANYVLRAVLLPAGNHKIEFKFHPEKYYQTNNYAMISSILLYLLFGAALFMAFKKKDEDNTMVAQKESIK